jgi:hypothetical protein
VDGTTPLLATVLLVLAGPGAARAQAPLSVVALGAEEPPAAAAPAPPRPPPGLTPSSPARVRAPESPPALAVLVDGRARILVDPAPGTSLSARARSLELGGLQAVLLSSTRPRNTAELPLLLGESGGPGGTVRLVGPAAGGPWPSTSRWAGALFGSSGLYASLRASPRNLRVVGTDASVGTERRVALDAGVSLRAVSRGSPDGPLTSFRIERGGASVVVLGPASAQPGPALTALVQGADLLVASLPSAESGRGLASLLSSARVGSLWVVAAVDPQDRQGLGQVAPTVVWSSRGEQPVTHASEDQPATGECRTDADCGAGRVCIGCSDQGARTCVTGCRSKADCPAGQACVQVECIRCPCPAQCTGR